MSMKAIAVLAYPIAFLSTASLARAADTSPSAPAVTCKVKGLEAAKAAIQKAFTFDAVKVGDVQGSCLIELPSVVASAGQDDAITCQASFFGGRILNNAWRLSAVQFSGKQYKFNKEPKYPTHEPLFVITLVAERGKSTVLTLRSIELLGPNCKEWPKAFEPSAPEEQSPQEHVAPTQPSNKGVEPTGSE